MSTERLGVIGVGYVGLVTAACFAQAGYDVACLDIDEAKLARLRAGEAPIHEPGVDQLLAESRERLTFTSSATELFERADVAFVCVDTPPTASGDADLRRVESVIEAIPPGTTGAVLVMKSTVPPGTGSRLRLVLDERGLDGVAYASNPEFLREGSAIKDFQHPDRVVVGADDAGVGERIAALYRAFGGSELITDVTSAEMIKHASNAFLATKISFINEIATVCEEVGANVDLVARGMGLDARIGPSFLRPGLGFGGSCFPKDVAALKQLAGNSGYHFQLLSAVIEVNELQKRRAIAKLKRHLGSLRDRRIALWGLAFKPDTDDMREASSVVLAARLVAEGAEVAGYDPVVLPQQAAALLPRGIELSESALAAARAADAVVIVTEWPEFATPFGDGTLLEVMRTPLVIDGRNQLDPAAVRAAGFAYEGVGRGDGPPEHG
ncbi:MAG: UDPglucose 6-dehydrogenase [Gaiellales bacterium]|nr:UDPglucose 6-dehydrogenase [Gaiellales bacterium]